MGKEGKSVTVGFKYFAGVHMALCHGPVDKVLRIIVGERDAYSLPITSSSQVYVNKPNLFGGKAREGGVQGYVDVEFGGPAQGRNSYLASKLGANVPAFRGVLGLVLRKVMLSMMNPYVKPWSAEVQRVHVAQDGATQWYDAKAGIPETYARQLVEDFSEGIGSYAVTTGPAKTVFSIIGDTYGPALKYTSGLSVSATGMARTLDEPVVINRFRARVKVLENKSDDAPSFAAGSININPCREAVFESARRALLTVAGYTFYMGEAGGTARLTIGQWYEFDIVQSGATWVATLTRLADGVVVDTESGSGGLGTASNIAFGSDGNVNTTSTLIDSIILDSVGSREDMNPAHIVREVLTNSEWGMGYTSGDLDDTSFTAAADTLFSEGFGLSILWDQQGTIDDFLRMILRHIDGVLFVDPATGLFTLKLIRGDYVLGSLPAFDDDEVISVEEFSRPTPSEMYNAVTVKWIDRENKQQSTTVHDLAGIASAGQEIATPLDMPGIARAELAVKVAMRELGQVSRPLAKATVILTRAASVVKIGDVIRLTLAEQGLAQTPMRVLGISYGTLLDGAIRVQLVEDVFALPAYTYTVAQASQWTTPYTKPSVAVNRVVMEAPWWTVVREITGESATAQAELDPDGGFVVAGAARLASDASGYSVWTRIGAADYVERGSGSVTPSGYLQAAIGKTTTVITLASPDRLELVDLGTYAAIDVGTANEELVKVKAVDLSTGTVTIARGVLDTVPHEHAAGALLYFLEGDKFTDDEEHLSAEVVNVKMLSKTSLGELALESGIEDGLTFAARHVRPYPPGNVQIAGAFYPPIVQSGQVITWAHRDRTQQTAYIVEQDEASIGPEAGTTYTIEVRNAATNALLDSVTGFTGTSYTIPDTIPGGLEVKITITALRAGRQSWQSAQIVALIATGAIGWSRNWGGSWGSATVEINLRSAFDVKRGLLGSPGSLIWWRAILPSGDYIDVELYQTTTDEGVQVRKWTGDGKTLKGQRILNSRVTAASYDASTGVIAIANDSIGFSGGPRVTVFHAENSLKSGAGLLGPTGSGAAIEITAGATGANALTCVAAGGSVFVRNYAGTELGKYNATTGVLQNARTGAFGALLGVNGTQVVIGGPVLKFLKTSDLTDDGTATFTPTDTIQAIALIGGEILTLEKNGTLPSVRLYRYSLAGAAIANYPANNFSSSTSPAFVIQKFGRYVSAGENSPSVYDTLASWATVPNKGYVP